MGRVGFGDSGEGRGNFKGFGEWWEGEGDGYAGCLADF